MIVNKSIMFFYSVWLGNRKYDASRVAFAKSGPKCWGLDKKTTLCESSYTYVVSNLENQVKYRSKLRHNEQRMRPGVI